ncbi:MAG: hypothetical protein JST52_04175 [Bacteroidetes bacterium]|nr:hypothetical protein [Bacteroidota bacterium]
MESSTPFFIRIITKPPMFFPFVALFHLFMLSYGIWMYRDWPVFSIDWLSNAWLLTYFIVWIFVCDFQRWAANIYLALTVFNILLYYLLPSYNRVLFTPPFLPVYILFSFLLLWFYRKFGSHKTV